MIEVAIFLAGCAISWLIAHIYHRRSATETPRWARELIDNLPAQQPKPSELLKLFQEHIDSGDIKLNHPLGRVACPDCNAPAKTFEEKVFGDDAHTIVVFTCPECGWSDHAEV